ncbi:MAG: hypothetical protein Q7R33_00825 [Nitrosarchaeum sp.]|nr:hypothetical protein [Nitrosarchaeum sp.]
MADEDEEGLEDTGKEETGGKKKEKGSAITTAAAIIQKRFGRSIAPSGDYYKKAIQVISTGSILLNNAIGKIKGIPVAAVVEVFGWEGAGKTLLLYLAIAEAQRTMPDRPCVLIDAERQFKFQAEWAAKVGVDVAKLIVIPVSTAEEAFDIIHALVLGEHEYDKKTNEVIRVINPGKYAIIGIDSVTQLVSSVDATKGMGDSRQRGSQASAIGLGLKKVTSAMARSDVDSSTILYFINQLRKNPNKRFGNPEYRTGGNALPFYDTLAFKVAKKWKSEVRDENGVIISHDVVVTFEKNKAGSMPEDAIVFTLRHDGSGVDNKQELFDVAFMNGIVKEYVIDDKTRYNFVVPETGKTLDENIKNFSRRKFDTILDENPKIKEKIMALIEDRKIFVKKDSVKEDVPDSAISEDDESETVTDDNDSKGDEPRKSGKLGKLRIR